MSTMIHHQPTQSTWGMGPYGRMSSVEELDSSLNLLSRHNSRKGLPLMTPPGTPLVARSPESRFDYSPKSPQQPEPVAHIPPNTPVTPLLTPLTVVASHDFGEVEACSPRSSGNGISKAAIDNKIEQAMDLVKTHLTFAVREEVETLRVTIAELELKVASLESENQLLRQYAPVEVVSQLPSLVQQQKSTTAPPQPSAATLPLSPPKVPAGFCSSTFATTLNNVVGDVRQEMAMAAQNNTQQEQEGGTRLGSHVS